VGLDGVTGGDDRTDVELGEGIWSAMPVYPADSNGTLIEEYVSSDGAEVESDYYMIRGDGEPDMFFFDSSVGHPARLSGAGAFGTTETIGSWNAIVAGFFTMTIDGVFETVTGIDFTAATDMNDVANILQAATRAETGGSESVYWCTDFDDNAGATGYLMFESGTPSGGGGSLSVMGGSTNIGATLTGGASPTTPFGAWTGITNGGFDYTLDGVLTQVTGCNFTGDLNMFQVGSSINSCTTGASVVWTGSIFTVTSSSRTAGTSAITVLSSPTAGAGVIDNS